MVTKSRIFALAPGACRHGENQVYNVLELWIKFLDLEFPGQGGHVASCELTSVDSPFGQWRGETGRVDSPVSHRRGLFSLKRVLGREKSFRGKSRLVIRIFCVVGPMASFRYASLLLDENSVGFNQRVSNSATVGVGESSGR